MNKFHISIPNCHTGNEIKMKVSGSYSSLFEKRFSLIFQKNFGGGGGTEESRLGSITNFDRGCLLRTKKDNDCLSDCGGGGEMGSYTEMKQAVALTLTVAVIGVYCGSQIRVASSLHRASPSRVS